MTDNVFSAFKRCSIAFLDSVQTFSSYFLASLSLKAVILNLHWPAILTSTLVPIFTIFGGLPDIIFGLLVNLQDFVHGLPVLPTG